VKKVGGEGVDNYHKCECREWDRFIVLALLAFLGAVC